MLDHNALRFTLSRSLAGPRARMYSRGPAMLYHGRRRTFARIRSISTEFRVLHPGPAIAPFPLAIAPVNSSSSYDRASRQYERQRRRRRPRRQAIARAIGRAQHPVRRRRQLLSASRIDLAGRSQAARPHHRRVAADRGALSGLMTHTTPFFEFVLVIPCALLILFAALLCDFCF
jgi:hypothetical protein